MENTKKNSKYIFFYNGLPFPVNSLEELAKTFFGMKVYRGDNGNWFIQLNNNPKRMEYASKENGGGNGYTQEEAEKDFLRFHFTFNYNNTALYRLVE